MCSDPRPVTFKVFSCWATILLAFDNRKIRFQLKYELRFVSLFQVEARIRQLESGNVTRISGTARQSAKFDK
jgi:hypothetical protein